MCSYILILHQFVAYFENQFLYIQVKLSADASSTGTIIGSECECKAGSGHCSHSLGLLYLMSHYQKLGLASMHTNDTVTAIICMLHYISKINLVTHLQLFYQSKAKYHCHRRGIFPVELKELLQSQWTAYKY